jgi:ABC-type enterochelin transport system ATPase subunit
MSFITINNIWQEYGDHVVLENLNLTVKEGEFCSMVGRPAAVNRHSYACCWAGIPKPGLHHAGR